MTVMTENILVMENNFPKKLKKSKKKEIHPYIKLPEKSSEEKDKERELFDLVAKRRLKAHMKREKWRNQVNYGPFGF